MSDVLPVEFETVPCDLCGSTEAETVLQGPDRLLELPGRFTVVRCCQCGLVRQNPRPTAQTIGFYYPPSYEPYSVAIDDEPSAWRRFDRRYGLQKRQRAIERHVRSGRLLDVGCATGNFLHEMARAGRWQVEGVEPNPEAAAYARTRFGLPVHAGRLTEVELAPASFDVITLWNVLEHLHDPLPNLRAVQRLLKPGGIFVFSIPNMESVEARLFGPYWLGWELPRHLYFFPRPVIERTLGDIGMPVVGWSCLVGAYPSFLLTYRFALEGMGGHTAWTRVLLGLARSLPARLLAAPGFWMLTAIGRASLITGFARREVA